MAFLAAVVSVIAVITLLRADSAWNILTLGASMFVPFFLANIGFSSGFIGGLLLLVIVSITFFAQQFLPDNSLLLIMLGLLLYKTFDLLFYRHKIQLEDITPAVTWLTALTWYQSPFFDKLFTDKSSLVAQQQLILLTLAITFALKPFAVLTAGPDRFFLKRISICAIGGLALLYLTNTVLLKPLFAFSAALYAGGLFAALLVNSAFRDDKIAESDSAVFHRRLHFIILIGILALVGSRTFSTMSFLILAPTALLASASGAGAAIALFWTARVLLQTYVVNYNSNVTGINLMHPYVSASMFAGFFLSLLFTVNLMRSPKPWQDCLIFLTIALSSPILSNYFLHEEPTSGFLSSLLTASVLLVCLAPLLNASAPEPDRLNGLLLLPAISINVALFSAAVIAMGNETSTESRVQLAIYLTCGLAVITLIAFVISLLRAPRRMNDVL